MDEWIQGSIVQYSKLVVPNTDKLENRQHNILNMLYSTFHGPVEVLSTVHEVLYFSARSYARHLCFVKLDVVTMWNLR